MTKELTLTSLAMLKVQIDQGGDYLDYLKPFVLWVLEKDDLDLITDDEISNQLRDKCGLLIPNRTVQIVLKRLARAGYIKKETRVYTVKKQITTNFDTEKAAAHRSISAVVFGLIEFSQSNSKKQITEEESIDSIITFLSKFSIGCLKSFLQGTALPQVSDENWKFLLVSQYIKKIHIEKPERFDSFIVLVKGHMLANALLCPDLQNVSQSYKKVTFFMDTPLLLQMIGLGINGQGQATHELVSLVKNLEGQLAYFRHTLTETINVIKKSAEFIDSDLGSGSVVITARKTGKTKSDLILLAEHVEENLEKFNVKVVETPSYINKFQIDESAFESILDTEVGYIYNPYAKNYDINSVRSIYVLRGTKKPRTIEECKAVLVTSNTAFAKAAYEYGKSIEASSDISTVITDFTLTNISWLKAPHGAPTLPHKEVIAFAYAALSPSSDFFNKVLNVAEQLESTGEISARDHQILRSSHVAQEELMGMTLGEDSALTKENITDTLSRISSEIKQEESDKLNREKEEHNRTRNSLREEKERNQKTVERIYWRSKEQATWISGFAIIFIAACILYGVFIGYKFEEDNWWENFLTIKFVGTGIFFIFVVANLCIGTTIENLYQLLCKRIGKFIFKRKCNSLGIDSEAQRNLQ